MRLKISCIWSIITLSVAHFHLFYGQAAFAQQQRAYRVKSLDQASKVLPYSARYQHDQFIKGKIYLKSGEVNVARYNYNFLTNEIQFLSPADDTLSLRDNNLVRFASIGDSVYYKFDKYGYVQILAEFGKEKLARKQGMVSLGTEKYVGYGQYIPTASTNNVSSYISRNGQQANLDGQTLQVITHRISYFFIDANGKIYPAYKGSLLKIFSKYREEVMRYLDKNPVDFNNEDQLRDLVKFCDNLRNAN